MSNSYLPSFAHLPEVEEMVPEEDSLREMTPSQLQEVISHLRSRLSQCHALNFELLRKLEMTSQGKGSAGQNKADQGKLNKKRHFFIISWHNNKINLIIKTDSFHLLTDQ